MLSLVRELVIKDLKVRYARPALGFFWVFLSPFLMVVIFYVVFGVIIKLEVEEAPFFLYLMSAVFPWNFFQHSIMSSVASLVENKNIIRESRFPHYLIPISIVLANTITFLPSLLTLIIISLVMLKGLPLFILFFPIALLIHLVITMALAVLFSILYVRWRDLRYVLEAILLLLFYSTPVFYSLALVQSSLPSGLFKLYMCNPFVGILNLYRTTLLKGSYVVLQKYSGIFPLLIVPLAFSIIITVITVLVYRDNKDKINDYISY